MHTPSAAQHRERFLIALAKFLGEGATSQAPLRRVQVCDDWFIDELLEGIIEADGLVLTVEQFNRLMLNCGRALVTKHFFQYFFNHANTIEAFESSVDDFRIRAMWLYGNFRHGYKRLATSDQVTFRSLISRTERKDETAFTSREPFSDIREIPEEDLGYLGYVSGEYLRNLEAAGTTLKLLLESWDERDMFLKRFGSEKLSKVSAALVTAGVSVPGGLGTLEKSSISKILQEIEPDIEAQSKRQRNAQEIGQHNTHRYLTLPYLDVYVATSMRTQQDYLEQHRFVTALFADNAVKDLHLRYFDPTASYDADRIKKGLIECLMLRRASVTIYTAGAEDTMGKDSELAATLAQGKPVIVFVPSGIANVSLCSNCGHPRSVELDRRAELFNVKHPLGLQTSARTGVAHGIVVVRSVEQCARMLRKILLHDLSFSIKHEGGSFLLQESETQSVMRVVSDDPLLTHSFWAYFRHTEPEPDI
jgi:hypothetical protein